MKFIFIALFLTGCGFEVVDTGNRGVQTRFGEITGEPLMEGLHFYNPFTSDITELSVREVKGESETACFTRDTQNVGVKFAITYYPEPTEIGNLYKQFGTEWDEKIVSPIVLQSLKDTVGRYVADDLVGKREEATKAALTEIQRNLALRHVVATTFSITNLDFDDKYEKAVEDKVVAVQKAAESKNKTVEVQENARQKVIAAEAEAKSMSIRAQALSQNKGLVEWEAVQRWNGQLPTQMFGGGTVPFINVTGSAAEKK